jgi:hypothetical protein
VHSNAHLVFDQVAAGAFDDADEMGDPFAKAVG